MDVSVDEFVDRLLSDEAYQDPSDSGKLEEVDDKVKLPEWYDEKKFNQGKRFFWNNVYGFINANMMSLVSINCIPTIVNVLAGSRRSNSPYTSYKRYVSTYLHFLSWFQYDFKPGTVSWKSAQTVRRRHLKADRAAKLKGQGRVSQRDVALTVFTNIGFVVLTPDKFSIRQQQEGDWEGIIHAWRVVGYMLGLKDRYNICRDTLEETREICQRIKDRVFTPCFENVPEYFEHMVHVAVDGFGAIIPGLEKTSLVYRCKYIADVPGYIYKENERIALQDKLRKCLQGQSPDAGVESTAMMEKCAIDGLPELPPRIFYLDDFSSMEKVPAYKALPLIGKYKLILLNTMLYFYTINVGRILLNIYIKIILFFAVYFPYIAMWRFGIKNAYVNMFEEDPFDDTVPKKNSEFYKMQAPKPWYKEFIDILW